MKPSRLIFLRLLDIAPYPLAIRLYEDNGDKSYRTKYGGIEKVWYEAHGFYACKSSSDEELCAVGYHALYDAREDVEYACRAAIVEGEAFGDVAGDIHTRILERMYGVLSEEKQYPYLMPHAVCRLADARETFHKSQMSERPLVNLGGKMWALFPWLGSYAFLALERFLKIRCGKQLGLKGMNSSRPYYMQFTMQVSETAFYQIVCEEAEKSFDALELVYPKEVSVFEKYDEYVPEELVRKGFAYGVLDLEGMRKRVLTWKKYGGNAEWKLKTESI